MGTHFEMESFVTQAYRVLLLSSTESPDNYQVRDAVEKRAKRNKNA